MEIDATKLGVISMQPIVNALQLVAVAGTCCLIESIDDSDLNHDWRHVFRE
ncbi:hypothetical protein [Psychrobacter glacincola]|uniref:hypothetical protein n=1 Tax=Psychrobacter glacincola TaxID=56810 RepID=UPI003D00FABD